MKHGTRPCRIDHRDYSFHASFGSTGTPTFKDEYFADAGLTMPDQEQINTQYNPPIPPLPYGCTDYTTADITIDLNKRLYNPLDLENVTHANALGGYDIRDALNAARGLGWFKAFYNVKMTGFLDYFDSFRLAQVKGLDQGESRSITWGTPWFPSWESAIRAGKSIMPMPTTDELNNTKGLPWHDSKLDGWTTRNGIVVYRDKSLQGNQIGEGGFIFFPREVINMVAGLNGIEAFTPSNIPTNPVTISVTTLQWIVSFLRNLLHI